MSIIDVTITSQFIWVLDTQLYVKIYVKIYCQFNKSQSPVVPSKIYHPLPCCLLRNITYCKNCKIDSYYVRLLFIFLHKYLLWFFIVLPPPPSYLRQLRMHGQFEKSHHSRFSSSSFTTWPIFRFITITVKITLDDNFINIFIALDLCIELLLSLVALPLNLIFVGNFI